MSASVSGIPEAVALLERAELAAPRAILATLEQIRVDAVGIMRDAVRASIRTTDKTSGELEASIVGFMETEFNGSSINAVLTVGSPLSYARFAAMDIAPTIMNRVIYMDPPGRFRYIGVRPPMPKHPFLEDSVDPILSRFASLLPGKFDEALVEMMPISQWDLPNTINFAPWSRPQHQEEYVGE